MLDYWQKKKNVQRESIVKPSDKFHLLCRLAICLHMKHERRFRQEDMEKIWSEGFSRHYPNHDCKALLSELEIYNGIIYYEGDSFYSLGHLSYQEYLTANAIMYLQKQKFLIDKYFDPWWKNVIIFYAGLCGDITVLLKSIQERHALTDENNMLTELMYEARFTSTVTNDFLSAAIKDSEIIDDNEEDYDNT